MLGHSVGGVVGLALADGGFDVSVQAVIGPGIKVAWTDEELGRARAVAHRPPAWFASRDEAAARYLRISGLAGLLAADSPAVDVGLREQYGRWRLAMDPGALAVGAPDMAQLLARTQAPVAVARGEHDAMNTDEQLTRLGVPTVTLPGLGHLPSGSVRAHTVAASRDLARCRRAGKCRDRRRLRPRASHRLPCPSRPGTRSEAFDAGSVV